MSDGRGKGRRGGRSMSSPPPRPSPPQRPPAASNVSSLPLPINYLSSPKSPPSIASPSSSASVSTSVSDLYVCTPYVAVVPLVPVLAVIVIICPPCNYCDLPCPFSSLMMGSVICEHFVPEGTGLLLVLVCIKKLGVHNQLHLLFTERQFWARWTSY